MASRVADLRGDLPLNPSPEPFEAVATSSRDASCRFAVPPPERFRLSMDVSREPDRQRRL